MEGKRGLILGLANKRSIAWGIANEVHGDWNHTWFTWGMPITQYLNGLYAHVRSVDANSKPIMYSTEPRKTIARTMAKSCRLMASMT